MAPPILLELPPHDPRGELLSRLQNAPVAHAEALLAAYEVLQGLHDRGALDLMRGALGSSDKVLEILVETTRSPESIRGIRNLLLVVNMLGELDPEALATFTKAIPPALASMAQQSEPPSLWRQLRNFLASRDIRRGLFAANTLLETFGKSLAAKNHHP